MKIKLIYATFGLCTLLLSGCYTVLYGPRMTVVPEKSDLAVVEKTEQYEPPTLDRYDEYEEEDWEDFYRYPGLRSGYGGGYGYGGYPYYGDGYGYSGYGSYPYYGYSGYGPSSYGYDPYYRDRGGYYVPVGYELVTERELDDLRASSQAQDGLVDQIDSAELERQRLEQQRKEEEVWTRRVEPRVRPAPVATPRSTSSSGSSYSPPPAPSKPAASSSSSSGSSSSSSSSEKKSSPKPKKRRR